MSTSACSDNPNCASFSLESEGGIEAVTPSDVAADVPGVLGLNIDPSQIATTVRQNVPAHNTNAIHAQPAPKTLKNELSRAVASCRDSEAKTPFGTTMHQWEMLNCGSFLACLQIEKHATTIQAIPMLHRMYAPHMHTEYTTLPTSCDRGWRDVSARRFAMSWPFMSIEKPPWPKGVSVVNVVRTIVASRGPWR